MTEAIETHLEENQMGGLYLRSCILISHFKKISFPATSLKTYHSQHTNLENAYKWIHLNAIFIIYVKTLSRASVSEIQVTGKKKKLYHYDSFNHVLLLCFIIPAL